MAGALYSQVRPVDANPSRFSIFLFTSRTDSLLMGSAKSGQIRGDDLQPVGGGSARARNTQPVYRAPASWCARLDFQLQLGRELEEAGKRRFVAASRLELANQNARIWCRPNKQQLSLLRSRRRRRRRRHIGLILSE